MKYGLFATRENIKKTEMAKEIMCNPGIEENEAKTIEKGLRIEKFMNYSSRGLISLFAIYLYKKKYFEKSKSFFKKRNRNISFKLRIFNCL